MPEFIADTDGTVNGCEWSDLSPFLQGYLEAMFFTNCCTSESMVEWEEPEVQERVREGQADGSIPTDAGFGDIHPDSMIAAHGDCSDFQAKARHLLSQAYALDYDESQAGRDFWFTRNGHGVGYWDRKELEAGLHAAHGAPRVDEPGWSDYTAAREETLGRKLTEIAETYGEIYVDFVPDESSPTGYGFVHLS
jgi:hypothetical protein